MPATSVSFASSLWRHIISDIRTLQTSLPPPTPSPRPDTHARDLRVGHTLPEPQPIAALLRSLGVKTERAGRCSTQFMRTALALKSHHEAILSRTIGPFDPEIQQIFSDAYAANFKRIINTWVLHITVASHQQGNMPQPPLLKGPGPAGNTDGHDDISQSSPIEECPPVEQVISSPPRRTSLAECHLADMLEQLSLEISEGALTELSLLPTTAIRYAHRLESTETPLPVEPLALRIIPNSTLKHRAFFCYAAETPATLVPSKSRRRKVAGLPRRATDASPSTQPDVLGDMRDLAVHVPSPTPPVHMPAGTASSRRRKIAPLPVRTTPQVRARDSSPTPSLDCKASPSPLTPTFGLQRSVSRTPSLVSSSSDDDSSSSGPSTPTSPLIELPALASPFTKFTFADTEDTPDRTVLRTLEEPLPRTQSKRSSKGGLHVTTPGSFIQPYGASLTTPTATNTFASHQASLPRTRRVAGLPGSKKAGKRASSSGIAAPSSPVATPESAFGKFAARTPPAGASFNFSFAK